MASAWREPSSLLPLRWGTWQGRSWGGLALIIGGGAAIAGSSAANAVTPLFAVAGTIAHVIGWSVLPSRGWRRVAAILPSTFAMFTLLAGPAYLTVLVIPFLAWLLVRHRPLRVAPMAAFVIATGIVLARIFPGYDGMLTAASVALFVVVGSAWAARAVHAASSRTRRTFRRTRSISS
ncbi:MAG: hypothetical protein ABI566_08340 [Pseudolysinimonas sp.]